MQGPHCPKCAGYEDRVIRRRPGEELPPDVVPCADFAMSERFRDWAVSQMRAEMMGQIGAAGLDRMAILKGKPQPGAPEPKATADTPAPANLVQEAAKAAGTTAPSVAQATGAVTRKPRPTERPPVGFRDING